MGLVAPEGYGVTGEPVEAAAASARFSDYLSDELDYLRAVGERIRSRRLAARLTQRELARRANMDRVYLGQIERAEHGLKIIPIRRIAAALGLTLPDLLPGELPNRTTPAHPASGSPRPGRPAPDLPQWPADYHDPG